MSPHDQRVAVAEFYGFTKVYVYEDSAGPAILVGDPPLHHPLRYGRPDRHIPDYLNDLNAVNVVETRLSEFQRISHGDLLQEILRMYCVGVFPDYHKNLKTLSHISSATASQRVEVLLKVVGKWVTS